MHGSDRELIVEGINKVLQRIAALERKLDKVEEQTRVAHDAFKAVMVNRHDGAWGVRTADR